MLKPLVTHAAYQDERRQPESSFKNNKGRLLPDFIINALDPERTIFDTWPPNDRPRNGRLP